MEKISDKNTLLPILESKTFQQVHQHLQASSNAKLHLAHLVGSASSLYAASLFSKSAKPLFFIANTEEEAAYVYTDLIHILDEQHVFFFPSSKTVPWSDEPKNHAHDLMRSEVLHLIHHRPNPILVVTYPEAIAERIITSSHLQKNSLEVFINQSYSIDFLTEFLIELGFHHVDFVQEPGQFSVRGGIVDVFSYADEYPFRIEFFDDTVESIRSFDVATQLSIKNLAKITLLPDLNNPHIAQHRCSFLEFIPQDALIWLKDSYFLSDRIDQCLKTKTALGLDVDLNLYYESTSSILHQLSNFSLLEESASSLFQNRISIHFYIRPQPLFKKHFSSLAQNLQEYQSMGYQNLIFFSNAKQSERLFSIFENMEQEVSFTPVFFPLHEGFIDEQVKLLCYADHQIFERYHRFKLKDGYQKSQQALTLKDLISWQKGDYVAHIQHGIGVYDGLEKININGKVQEAMRILYSENDILYVNIHALHKVSKYTGKEGKKVSVDKLGSKAWQALKQKTKKKVKEMAFDLIKLYAKRKAQKGFGFSPDNYLQNELEASFIYEDTPDQLKATNDVKCDMEKSYPMDRLVCGDVGFGKTEVAIRAAFKAALDGKQVAVLAPTTILTLQHYKTFQKRLQELPCKVDYLNRFKSPAQQKETIERLKEGKIDIIIGTHRLVSQDIQFKDLGLLIVDEEHKFGVNVKDKLKTMRVNVDTLTLTATPIPRTLQFSLMSARDLSVMNTPPANRQPVQTELHVFDETIIRDSIYREISRGGQVFFIHNRVSNLEEVAGMIQRLCPEVSVGIGHGQMKPEDLEEVILRFMDGAFDVLVSTTIVESGLDISNANTMIINDAHTFGLSDLHQMRGRVGRSNRKAYCYLLSPPLSVISSDARKRLKVIEQFSDLGSGFQISMRDLDIRGAGDLLGGEQSGFISEMGYEMYQKILDEAIRELKQNEFKEVFEEELEAKRDFVDDCQIDTDLELLFPDSYINNVAERLTLYKDLSDLEQESDLQLFKQQLEDRFGALPMQAINLLDAIRLRWLAKQTGFEKLVLKNGQMVAYFISDPKSMFYQSEAFQTILKNIQNSGQNTQLKQKHDRLYVSVNPLNTIAEALLWLKKIENKFTTQ